MGVSPFAMTTEGRGTKSARKGDEKKRGEKRRGGSD